MLPIKIFVMHEMLFSCIFNYFSDVCVCVCARERTVDVDRNEKVSYVANRPSFQSRSSDICCFCLRLHLCGCMCEQSSDLFFTFNPSLEK